MHLTVHRVSTTLLHPRSMSTIMTTPSAPPAFLSPLLLSQQTSSTFTRPTQFSSDSRHCRLSWRPVSTTPSSTQSRRRTPVKAATLRPKIAIIGGGHAGISTALRLASLPWTRLTEPEITLIDKTDRFVFLPLLYDLSMGQVSQWEVAPKFTDLVQGTTRPKINFVQANVENLDLSSRAVEGTNVQDDSEFRYLFDKAILAVGAEVANLDKVPGASEHALPYYTLEHALQLKERLAEFKKQPRDTVANVVVVGGGLAGIELASCVADDLGRKASVMVIESGDRIMDAAKDFNRYTCLDVLSELNVPILYNTRVTNVDKDHISTSDNQTYPADLVLWTAGSRPSQAQAAFGVPLTEQGYIDTNEYLQVKQHEDTLYALGDAAVGGGNAQIAVQQAEYAAWNCWADSTGGSRKLLKWRYAALGEMMILGRERATVSTALKGADISGRPAWIARRLAYLIRMPTERHRKKVAASWSMNPVLDGVGNLIKAGQQYR